MPGQAPFGTAAFAASPPTSAPKLVAARHQIAELQIHGAWAWMRPHVEVTPLPPDAADAVDKAGHILAILRKDAHGRWRLARDTNLLS